MEQEVYGREVAKFICELLVCRKVPNPPVIPDELEIRDDGVYVKNVYLASDPAEQAFTWTPACEMDWPGAPDPLTAPSLPIPFTAKHLAAFMLDAVGYGKPKLWQLATCK